MTARMLNLGVGTRCARIRMDISSLCAVQLKVNTSCHVARGKSERAGGGVSFKLYLTWEIVYTDMRAWAGGIKIGSP